MSSRVTSRPAEQVGSLQIFTLPPQLHIQSLSPNPSSIADYLLLFLLMLYPNSQGTKKILVEHPSFLPPVGLLTSPFSLRFLLFILSQAPVLLRYPLRTWFCHLPAREIPMLGLAKGRLPERHVSSLPTTFSWSTGKVSSL